MSFSLLSFLDFLTRDFLLRPSNSIPHNLSFRMRLIAPSPQPWITKVSRLSLMSIRRGKNPVRLGANVARRPQPTPTVPCRGAAEAFASAAMESASSAAQSSKRCAEIRRSRASGRDPIQLDRIMN
jgi:hypothetical protein